MSTLNILCPICSEFYKPDDKIYSTTTCGHLFHEQCLLRWLNQSLTCPQCRRACHRNRIHRVFLNFSEPPSAEEEAALADLNPIAYNWIALDASDRPGEPETVPAGAIKCGVDSEGNDAYVARVYLYEDLLPANYVPQKGGVYAPWSCKAHFLRRDVELLVGCDHTWVSDRNGHVPTNALVVGYSETGENLYTGRAMYEGKLIPGKVHPSHHVLYMPYEGREVNVREYEVLVPVSKQEKQENA